MKSCSGGFGAVRLYGFVCLAVLLLSGCGTHMPGAAPSPSGAGSAKSAAIPTGPQLGLIWIRSDSTLRPLIGVPGAVRLGNALFAPGAYTNAAFSPASGTALLLDSKGDLQMAVLPSLQTTTVTRGQPSAGLIAFSPRGKFAVVYSPGATSALLISGMPQQVAASPVSFGGAIRGMAVSDQGTVVAATDATAGGVNVTAIASGGTRSILSSVHGFGGMAFVPGSEDLVLSDAIANTTVRLHNSSAVTLATHSNGVDQPFAAAISGDAHWAVVANHADGTLLRLDLTGATQPVKSTCRCSPSELLPLTGNALFEVADPGVAPGWMVEADDLVSRLMFIPPARSAQ